MACPKLNAYCYKDGILGVSDAAGKVTTINHEDESQWSQQSSGNHGWMVRCDEIGVYHGHSGGVTMYDWEDGRTIWNQKTRGGVLFGWQEEGIVYASTSNNQIYAFTKKGELSKIYQCDAPVYSCATTQEGIALRARQKAPGQEAEANCNSVSANLFVLTFFCHSGKVKSSKKT